MPSLTDLFNPTFLMFLGILVLVVALLVVYFESKMRDQNHKIASMLSLVSTLAEDMNGVKMGLNHLAMNRVGGSAAQNSFQQPLGQQNMPFFVKEENKLIEVSDDESSEDESDNDEEIGSDSDNDEYKERDSESDNESTNNIKVLTLNIHKNIGDIDESENLDLEETVSFGDFEPEDDLSEDELHELSEEYTEEILNLQYDELTQKEELLNLQYDETTEETKFISSSDLKTININLEESQTENFDFKKLSLPKLRSVVIEKGLASNLDANKFKKQELLKLLGVE
jgi:hypothetical protein